MKHKVHRLISKFIDNFKDMESTLFIGRDKKAAVYIDNDQIIQISLDLGKFFPAAGVNKNASEDRRKNGDIFCGCSLKTGTWVWASVWMAEW